tara:strand:- start:72 stop:338 length:267 start_codon:yes stop_codon:yes gene_type:complete
MTSQQQSVRGERKMKQRKRDLSNSRVSKEGDSSVNLTCETQLPYREFGRTNLVSEDVSVFFDSLKNPPTPTKRLKKAFALHRVRVIND